MNNMFSRRRNCSRTPRRRAGSTPGARAPVKALTFIVVGQAPPPSPQQKWTSSWAHNTLWVGQSLAWYSCRARLVRTVFSWCPGGGCWWWLLPAWRARRRRVAACPAPRRPRPRPRLRPCRACPPGTLPSPEGLPSGTGITYLNCLCTCN